MAHGDTDVYELMYPGSETAEKTAALEASHKRIAEFEAVHGAEASVQFAELLTRIRDLNASPKSSQRLDISGACWALCSGNSRPPTLEELRKQAWLIHARPAAEKRARGNPERSVDKLIQLDWERQDGTLGPIKDLSQFKREVEDMGLELADARLIKSHRECFGRAETQAWAKSVSGRVCAGGPHQGYQNSANLCGKTVSRVCCLLKQPPGIAQPGNLE